ncbi:PorT family protein [Euzebyella marina]|uniref:PorT family protein n=1 Tax=Euzebyella marina TaxID=1761453 RepID=A0A3G2L1X2_9FLAO|nr:porin family protein [Euzebyella marina]AYN66206.1 PorT family protein [Euzebyella marina]
MKNLLFVFFLTIGSFCSSAQDFGFGVKAGVNISNLGGDYYVGVGNLGSRVAFHLGGVVEVPITDKISVQPELLYSSQGSNWDYGSNGDNLKLDYVNLPILGKYHILQGLSAEAGPVVGFLVSSNADDDQFKNLDIGFGIGASYKLANNIFFSLRYNKGIANVKGENYSGSSQNNIIQISAGYAF